MGIVHDGGVAARRAHRLETSCHRFELAHLDQHLLRVKAQQHGSAIDRQQVVGIEASREQHFHHLAVDRKRRAVESLLDDASLEVGHRAQRVAVLVGTGVLDHHLAHLVIGIHQCKRPGRQRVKEHLLGGDVVVHRLVEVHVVTGQVGEDAAGKGDALDAALHTGM